MKYIDTDTPIKVPREIAVCPKCDADIVIESIDEWDDETGRVTDCGLHYNCVTEPDIGSDDSGADDWHEWFDWHGSYPYMDWMPLESVIHGWFDMNYRIRVCREN